VTHVIREVFAHIRNQLTFLLAVLFCLLWCIQSYPFQPHRLIVTMCLGLLLWTSIALVIAVVRFNRNEVLSRIADTTPNQFTFDRSLWLPLITYVFLPLITLLAIEFPLIGRSLFGWMGDLHQLLRI
jgi:hypothetical protein